MGWKTSGGGSGPISVPTDLEFSDTTLPLCEAKRNTFFDDNPGRRVDKVRVLLKPAGAPVVLQQLELATSTWRDQTAVIRGPIGITGPVGTKAALGLDLVDNTTDAGKPISTATQGALDLKADKTELALKADIDDTDAALLLKLNISDAATLFAGKQDKLTSGTNLKTVNGESLLGAGNIALAGGSGMTSDQIAQLSRLNSLTYAPVDVVWTSGTLSNAGNDITGTAPNIVDGVTLAIGMRVLHATGGLDGIYEVTSISGSLMEGSWTRAADMRAGSTFTAGAQVVVRRGTRNAGKTWTINRFSATGVVGTNLSTWEPNVTVSGLSNPTAGQVFKATTGPNGAWGDLTAAEVGALAAALRGAANGVASLEADGKLKLSELPDSIVAGLKWQGTWNATTNAPAIPAAAVGNNGFFYRVATAGTSNVTGSSVAFAIGDWLISNGTAWQRVENTLDLVNDLSTGGTGKALAAAQGPAIKTLIDAKPDLATAVAVAAGTAAVGVSTKAAREDHVHPAQDVPALATAAPLAAGTANVGVSLKTAREDHVHPAQTIPAIVNDLTTGGATATLSAEQGKILAGRAVAPDWALANTYAKNALVRYTDDQLYMANATIPTTTAWSVGTTGATWRAVGATALELATATPAALGTAAVGTGTKAAREDHVHALPAAATASVAGLMSAADKTKLDGVATGATALSLASATPVADTVAGAVGTGTTAARADHSHPALQAIRLNSTANEFASVNSNTVLDLNLPSTGVNTSAAYFERTSEGRVKVLKKGVYQVSATAACSVFNSSDALTNPTNEGRWTVIIHNYTQDKTLSSSTGRFVTTNNDILAACVSGVLEANANDVIGVRCWGNPGTNLKMKLNHVVGFACDLNCTLVQLN